MSDQPEEQRNGRTEQQAGDDRKVEAGVLSAVDDVAGEAAEAEGKFSDEIKERAYDDEETAENEKGAAEFAGRFHSEHSSPIHYLRS